jgi:hypothetical protein
MRWCNAPLLFRVRGLLQGLLKRFASLARVTGDLPGSIDKHRWCLFGTRRSSLGRWLRRGWEWGSFGLLTHLFFSGTSCSRNCCSSNLISL